MHERFWIFIKELCRSGGLVSLPGISVPAVCTPTPLTLDTPEFQSARKRPGKYSNKLTITFTPSSANL